MNSLVDTHPYECLAYGESVVVINIKILYYIK